MKNKYDYQMNLSQEEVKKVLSYDPSTGKFYWTDKVRKDLQGKLAGGIRKGKYPTYRIKIFNRTYSAHRLAILYMTGKWPKDIVGFKDNNPLNLIYWNLFECKKMLPHVINTHPNRNSTTGIRNLIEAKTRYVAQIKRGNKVYKKVFSFIKIRTKEEARQEAISYINTFYTTI